MSDLFTFIGGAAVGTLVTYLVKNEEARKTVDGFIDGVGKQFTDLLHRVTPGKPAEAEAVEAETVMQPEAKPEPVKKAARPRRTAKVKKVVAEENPVH
jgi:hypothetical protein